MKVNKFVAGFVAVAALFGAYRYGVNLGSDWRDEYHLKNDLRGDVVYQCESQIADNQQYRDVFVDFDKQRVYYSKDYDFNYDHHTTFLGDGAVTIVVLGNGFYASIMTMTNGVTRFFIEKNGHVLDTLYCTAKKQQ